MAARRYGASRKGRPNKSTQDIKKLIRQRVDFEVVIDKLMELVNGVTVQRNTRDGVRTYEEKPDSFAARILLEYGFGKPVQTTEVTLPKSKRLIIEDAA